ncbi:MAG: two-component system, NarL family, sensor histidine kinase UhpB [Thermoleophilaceae bacterium]|jgi:two-component system sensor histidine kinase UhpB|nr:two-component system, NarL family, sensor histidine kinase UhpB [Thermoleophilaceae bacterium]
MKLRSQTKSLAGQVLAVNVLLVVATLFAASAAANLNLAIRDQRWSFLLLALTILLVLLVNMIMLRRRFMPLERLIATIEAIDPSTGGDLTLPPDPEEASEEVGRLAASFRRMLVRIEDERRRSGRLVLRAQEEERRRLARDLHDEVNQALTAILLRLEALSQTAPPELSQELSELKRLVNQAMNELLQLARQLRPTALDDHGLLPAMASQVRRFEAQTGIKAELSASGPEAAQLQKDEEIAVYRIAQEALANVARHANATQVSVALRTDDDGVELTVRDDGRGFEPGEPNGDRGLGLGGMAERARLVGGELTIESRPGAGTELSLRVP